MRRALAAVLAVLGLVLGAVGAAPAAAGTGYWSATACHSTAPTLGMWWGEKGTGVWFRTGPNSGYPYIAAGVTGRFYAVHFANGAECGFGFPLSAPISQDGARVQYFHLPSQPCALRAIVVWPNGTAVPVTNARYFC